MNTQISIILDKRRMKKNGEYPIVFRLIHNRKMTSIATGYSVLEIHWDERKCEIKNSYKEAPSVHLLNQFLLQEKLRMKTSINKLHEKGDLQFLSLKDLKLRVTNQANIESFLTYGEQLVNDLKAVRRFGSARSYACTVKILKTFSRQNDIKFKEINYSFLQGFERFHLSKEGNSLNGLAAYMRTIRAIYNRAIKEGLAEKEHYPFYDYKIKTTPTRKRAIDKSYLKRIMELELSKEDKLFHVRNYFLCSYMLYGMPFMDMAYLKVKNIINGRVIYQRKKTSKVYDIKITHALKEILTFYLTDKNKGDFLFPIIINTDSRLQYEDVIRRRKKYNYGLKELANLCDIEEGLTSYVSRHSFATNAMLKKIPIEAISAMLGHSKLNTTQIYLKSLPNEVLDAYNESLTL